MILPMKNLYNYHFWNSFETTRYNQYLEETFQKMKKVKDQNMLQVKLNIDKHEFLFQHIEEDIMDIGNKSLHNLFNIPSLLLLIISVFSSLSDYNFVSFLDIDLYNCIQLV